MNGTMTNGAAQSCRQSPVRQHRPQISASTPFPGLPSPGLPRSPRSSALVGGVFADTDENAYADAYAYEA
jgi:hypothetical protein